MTATVHGFQTQVAKLLDLLANSLYSNKEVFLRELISNASDAIDKLHFMSLTNQDLVKDDPVFHIRIRADKDAGTLTISDNGLGMTLDEANSHLGTIAESGTEEFMKKLTGDAARDSQLIGQFGVGFYSSFIVADRVTVLSRSVNAKENEGVRWESTGSGTFESENIERKQRGTDVILHLKDSCKEFLEEWTLREAITKYSDHISVPVELWAEKFDAPEKKEGEDKESKPKSHFEWEQVNDAKALWTRNPKEVKDDEYKEFYKHLTHDYQDPLCWAHNKVEGSLEYTSLLYIPKTAPWDLYTRQNQHGLKLFVQRVFIMDKAEAFLPTYLRFVSGLVDTNALPLNISRELLQESAVTRKLKKALTKRALQMIGKLASDKDKYAEFWGQFGNCLKEGPVEDYDNRDEVLKLLRFASTKDGTSTQSVSLDDYIGRMVKGQDKIYYLTADSYEAAANSPYIENLKKKGIEVLLMWERIDEWLMGNISSYKDKEFVSASASDLKLSDELGGKEEKERKEASAKENKDLIERFKKALGDKVKGVEVSTRLTDSPSCVITDGNRMMTSQMKRLLEASGQKIPDEKYTLEINPDHPLVKKAYAEPDETRFEKWAEVIYEQALLSDQGGLKDPASFVKNLNSLLLG
ncbi:MAG: molecular chaperone HtpG [Succinatimonas hippei]|nr:molecular chaperone HtpG [Succinatimonas hippei]